jgi:hypothetical protein
MSSRMARDHGFLAFWNQPRIDCCGLKPPAADTSGVAASGSIEEMVSQRGLVRRIGRRSDPC